jgi:mannosyltransferase
MQFLYLKEWIIRNKYYLMLAAILLLTGFLRLHNLTKESIWFDEASSIYSAKRPLIDMLKDCVGWHRHPPLHFLFLKTWIILFGDGEFSVRLSSAIFGIASIPLIFIIGKQLISERVGIIASLLLSVSSYHIYYSQETRAYSLLVFFTLLSFIFFAKILKGNTSDKWQYFGYFIVNALLIYTHYFGLFVVASQLIFYFLQLKSLNINKKYFWNAQIATGMMFLPWAAVFVGYQIPHSNGWKQPTFSSLIKTVEFFSGNGDLVVFICIFLMILSILGIILVQSNKTNNKSIFYQSGKTFQVNLLLILWFTVPIIVPFLISQLPFSFAGIYVDRYTIGAVPAFYLLSSIGMNYFLSKRFLYPVFSIILLTILFFSSSSIQNYDNNINKEQWREGLEFSRVMFQDDDILLVGNQSFTLPIKYYYSGPLELSSIENNEIKGLETILQNGKHRIWLYQGCWGSTITIDFLLQQYRDQHLILKQRFVGVEVYLFNISSSSP